jgi:integrase
MGMTIGRLTVPRIKKLIKPGRYSDGANLSVKVRDNGAKHFVLYAKFQGRLIELGLGSWPKVSLPEAREKAAEGNALMRAGKNPKDVWTAQRRGSGAPTFAVVAQQYYDSMSGKWSARYREQVKADLFEHCTNLAGMPVDKITTDDVLVALNARGIRTSKLHLYIKAVLDAAQVKGHIAPMMRNPAAWRGHLDKVVAPAPKARHHPAMPYSDVPGFLERLRGMRRDSEGNLRIDAYGLEFLILCGVRSSEAREARWAEIVGSTWIIPGDRMKAGEEHAIPLGPGALAILAEMRKVQTSDFIFPGFKSNAPLTSKSFERLLKKMGYSITTHGFRSSLRNWLHVETNYGNEVCEEALAHTAGSSTERAYRRAKAMPKLRELFAAWDRFCQPKPAGNVVALHRA